jgi:hypothetical protein
MAQPSIHADDELWDDYDRALLKAQGAGDLPPHIGSRAETVRIAMKDVIARYYPESEYADPIGGGDENNEDDGDSNNI